MLRLFTCRSDSSATIESDKDYLTVDFSKHRPTYTVRYLGCEELYKPGLTQICETVNDMYISQKSRLKKLNHCFLTVTSDAIILREQDSTEDDARTFHLTRILYCGVLSHRQKIFFFNYQPGAKGDVVNCHIVLCENKEEAKSLAKVLSKAFKLAAIQAHHQDVENRKLHARGLSQSSLSHVDSDGRRYYNLKHSRGSLSTSSDFKSKGTYASSEEKDFRSGKGCNKYNDWEVTDSSRDDTSQSSFTAEIRDLIETSSITREDFDIEEESSSALEKINTDERETVLNSNRNHTIRYSFNIEEVDNWSRITDLAATDV